MKIIIVQLIVTIFSVSSHVIPYRVYPGVTIINAPPPGRSIAIQAPIVPNSIALIPAHGGAAVFADIRPDKVPAAVTVAESPDPALQAAIAAGVVQQPSVPAAVTIAESPDPALQAAIAAGIVQQPSVPAAVSVAESPISIPVPPANGIINIAGLPSPADDPASVTIVDRPSSQVIGSVEPQNEGLGGTQETTEVSETPETPETTEAPEPTEAPENSGSNDYNDINNDGSGSSQSNEENGGAGSDTVIGLAQGSSIIAGPSHTILTAHDTIVAGHHPAAVALSPAVVHPLPPVYLAAEGTYLAKTRGSEHFASLPGHINSASSINLEPAPGTV